MSKITRKKYFFLFTVLVLAVSSVFVYRFFDKSTTPIKASTVITTNDFRINAENKWDEVAEKNYAKLDWDQIPNLSELGYQLFQSEDGGVTWNSKSMNYGKQIKVLNIYPSVSLLKGWMTSLETKFPDKMKDSNGNILIDVTEVSYDNYNINPDAYLKNSNGDYQYDVLMFGTWDSNNFKDLNTNAINKTRAFANTGRGILWGHDTLAGRNPNQVQAFGGDLGIGYKKVLPLNANSEANYWTGSATVTITNNGYLMKYPFELPNNADYTIPYTHNIEQQDIGVGTVWLEFKNAALPPKNFTGTDGKTYRSGWYLKTNKNIGMIQTGHSGGASTDHENMIIANTLFNLAQASTDNFADDQTVKDSDAPSKPNIPVIRCGTDENGLSVRLNSQDVGTEYQWYVEANSSTDGVKKSDVIKEEIKSNIAGYFYEVTNSPTSTLQTTVEGYKDSYGRIAKEKYDAYIAPNTSDLSYATEGVLSIGEKRNSEKYLHVLAVDRANNVSEVTSHKICDLTQNVSFNIERTQDEAKLVDIALDNSMDNKMKSLEIQFSENIDIKNFSSLVLPTDWYSFENSTVNNRQSVTFAMESKNGLATIKDFLSKLRFTIKNPVNQSSDIRLVFHEKVYTSWVDPEGLTHYYTFVEDKLFWNQAYNKAKFETYKGLKGYLTTITSAEEHDFIYDNIAKKPGWLGGTALRKTNDIDSLINDEDSLPSNLVNIEQTDTTWYWANGPEAGQVYFDKRTRKSGGKAPVGVYDGWSTGEPNMNPQTAQYGGAEAAMIFAFSGKYWNDIPYKWTDSSNEGYYIEFSEYGEQTEGEEVTDLCWQEDVPQKISLKAFDDQGIALPNADLLFDSGLKIGQAKTAIPISLEMYDFIRFTDMANVDHSENYTVSKNYQEGKIVYSSRKAVIHIRQVILNENAELVVPSEGYGSLISYKNGTTQEIEQLNMSLPSSTSNTMPYDDIILRYTSGEEKYIFKPTIPSDYELVGYVWSKNATQHNVATASMTQNQMDVKTNPENWLTVYVKATNQFPTSYQWDYKDNNLGELITQ